MKTVGIRMSNTTYTLAFPSDSSCSYLLSHKKYHSKEQFCLDDDGCQLHTTPRLQHITGLAASCCPRYCGRRSLLLHPSFVLQIYICNSTFKQNTTLIHLTHLTRRLNKKTEQLRSVLEVVFLLQLHH